MHLYLQCFNKHNNILLIFISKCIYVYNPCNWPVSPSRQNNIVKTKCFFRTTKKAFGQGNFPLTQTRLLQTQKPHFRTARKDYNSLHFLNKWLTINEFHFVYTATRWWMGVISEWLLPRPISLITNYGK